MDVAGLATPVGHLVACEEAGAIVAVRWGEPQDEARTPLLREALAQLQAYFAGTLTRFKLPLRPQGTRFQQAVWQQLERIPYGETLSYGDLARRIASSPRAVGGACGRNPLPIFIPCHRVVGAGNTLTGYSGGTGTVTKRFLIDLEQKNSSCLVAPGTATGRRPASTIGAPQ